jgi:hypothetical protein
VEAAQTWALERLDAELPVRRQDTVGSGVEGGQRSDEAGKSKGCCDYGFHDGLDEVLLIECFDRSSVIDALPRFP